MESEMEIEWSRKQIQRNREKETEKTQGNIDIRDPKTANLRTHSKTKVPEKWAQQQRPGSTERRMEKETGGVGEYGLRVQTPLAVGASGSSHRWQWVGALRQSPATLPGNKNRWPAAT